MTEKRLGLLRDELKGYFGLLKHEAKNLSEKAIVEKIQRDTNKILHEVFDDD